MFVTIALFPDLLDRLTTILLLQLCSERAALLHPQCSERVALLHPHPLMCRTAIGMFVPLTRLIPRHRFVPLLSITLV